MGWRALGDSAWLFEPAGQDAGGLLANVLDLRKTLESENIPQVRDLVSSFATVAVHFDPADGGLVLDWLKTIPPPRSGANPPSGAALREIPVQYGGPDLAALAAKLNRPESEIIALHSEAEFTVAAVGFSPGFPYLTGLPQALQIPRLSTPRPVAAGSVAVAGNQAGIYPFESQGGWHVLGRTDVTLFDAARPSPALLTPGDRVRFKPVDSLLPPQTPASIIARPSGGFEVLEPGAFTTVQDLGRPGHQTIGVSPGGAADPIAARVVNRLVGNPDDSAVLECGMTGPVLRFHQAARLAFVGWADSASGKPHAIKNGGTIDLRGRMTSVRGYIAIAGGVDVPRILGSRATDVRAGLGGWHGRPLRAGDRLPTGPPQDGPRPGNWRVAWPHREIPGRTLELRFLPGMQAAWFQETARTRFREEVYQLSPMTDRTGTRLEGPALETEAHCGEMTSQPVVAGSVQVPPDGRPIILLSERQTIGGYPQIGHVISADLPMLARAWPGTRLRFREVTLEEARNAWRELRRASDLLHTGLRFLP
jgi:KipI family sensor histidine kinase inhibitor